MIEKLNLDPDNVTPEEVLSKFNELIDAYNHHHHNFYMPNIPGDGTVHELSTFGPTLND